jgi:hypothetical protein
LLPGYGGRMSRSIGGALDTAALARMHFYTLSPTEQAQAIRRLKAAGRGLTTIATATGLSVEAIAEVLTEHREGVHER